MSGQEESPPLPGRGREMNRFANQFKGMNRLSDIELVSGIRAGDDAVKSAMYLQYRDEFVRWAAGNMDIADAGDALTLYTDACVVAWDKISDGRYELKAGVTFKTYLFQIAKYMGFNARRKRKITMEDIERYETSVKRNDNPEYQAPDVFLTGTGDDQETVRKKRSIVKEVVFTGMAEPCRSIFRYIYYEKMSCSMVAEKMSYSGADTVKAQSYRCKRKLKAALEERFRKYDLI